MTMDFSGGAGASTPFDLIPVGQVAWAVLTVRGLKASAGGGQYLDCELTIDEGQPYAKKKLWDMIGDPMFAGNSDGYKQMGMVAITRIMEAGKGAGPNNPNGYKLNAYTELSGLKVAIKIGVEPGSNGHADKNKVAEYLTPNPASQSGHKGFERLAAGKYAPDGAAAKPAAAQAGFSGFGAQPAAGGAAAGGFGAAAATQQQPATSGFGSGGTAAATSGFQQAPEAGQSDVANAAEKSTAGVGFATTPHAMTSPSDPAATPAWLQQAGQQ